MITAALKTENTEAFSFQNNSMQTNANSNSLFEIAVRLQHDAVRLHSEGDHERANKSTIIAKEIQLIAVEKMLKSLRLSH